MKAALYSVWVFMWTLIKIIAVVLWWAIRIILMITGTLLKLMLTIFTLGMIDWARKG